MLVCVRWYAAYPLSLRNLEEMMAERGVVHFRPVLGNRDERGPTAGAGGP